ncbi:MAG TPA: hypothetical protein VMU51_22090 [Mycobacteriales bacterium]|nr:hypothetical protein [Mycobacteriales bacterium]
MTSSSPTPNSPRPSWHVALIGGLKRQGAWQVPAETISVALVGGAQLDLREATLAAPTVTVTKVSLIGGVEVTVPANIRVEVQAVHLIGARNFKVTDPTDPNAPVLRIRAYAIFGGVNVKNA